ncbi:trypsin-like serine peptidase [Zooshikella sp. RANM57]|uniref:trypsin-like serine peptidase n=1 Tax=Zooshikella sp. RANM57 TaxID=3425863 RepID=UPI003D6F7839
MLTDLLRTKLVASILLSLSATPVLSQDQNNVLEYTSEVSSEELEASLKPIIIADRVEMPASLLGGDLEALGGEVVINEPGASFIKVHFSEFDIPEGSWVTVSNKDGSEEYRYGNTQRDDFTVDNEEDGVNRWASMSITGDTAIVRLHQYEANSWVPTKNNLKISHYMRGYSENEIAYRVRTLSTCGSNERKDVACYERSHPTEFKYANAVGRLVMGRGLCTAWRVSADNRMFTNNHCMSTESSVRGSEVWFNYQRSSCSGQQMNQVVKVSGQSLLKTDYTLDYTLFTVNNFSAIRQFGYLGLEVRDPQKSEVIYIAQHGSGAPKQFGIESDYNSGNVCRVDASSRTGRASGTDLGYYCDTTGGSSGSPVLAGSSNKAIGLHHYGGCLNQGVKVSRIWPQVQDFFNNQVP